MAVPDLSRSQLFVYGAVAVALLLVGARSIRAEGGGESFATSAAFGSGAEATGAVSFDSTGPDLVVDVAGAVQDPGVYRLPEGSRVVDALARAGGEVGGRPAGRRAKAGGWRGGGHGRPRRRR